MKYQVPTLLLILIGLALGAWYQIKEHQLSEKPPEFSSGIGLTPETSRIVVRVQIPFATLRDLAESAVPERFEDRVEGPGIAGLDTRFEYTVTKQGLRITPVANDRVQIAVDLGLQGAVGLGDSEPSFVEHLRGLVTDHPGLGNPSFGARLEVVATVAFDLAPDWCPKLDVELDWHWQEAPWIGVGDSRWVTLRRVVEEALDSPMKTLAERLTDAIPCNAVRRPVQQIWKTESIPLEVPEVVSAHLNIRPSELAFSGVEIDTDSVRFAVALESLLEIGETPIPIEELPLPRLETVASTTGEIQLAVPISLSYHTLELALGTQVVGHEKVDTPAGPATLRIEQLRIYPSGKTLVIAVGISADLPDRWLDVRGWIYLQTIPEMNSEGTILELRDLTYSRTLDNPFWRAVSLLLAQKLQDELDRLATLDLGQNLASLEQAVLEGLVHGERPGLDIHVGQPLLRVGRIGVGEEALTVEVRFQSELDILFDPIEFL